MPKHAGGIAHRIASLDGAERNDLSHVVAPVFFGGVTNHLVAVTRVEVHIDIGHRDTVGVQKAFEQQVVFHRVKIGDAQCIGNCTPSRRTSSGADPNALFSGMANEIPHDEEIRRKAHVADDFEFVRQSLDHRLWHFGTPSLCGTGARQVFEVRAVVTEAGRDRKVGQYILAEFDGGAGTLSNPQRVVACIWRFSEQLSHFGGRLEIVLFAFEFESLGVGNGATRLHTQQCIVGLCVVTMHVMRVIGGQEWRINFAGNLDEVCHGSPLIGDAVVLELDEHVVAPKDFLQPRSGALGFVVVIAQQRLQHMAAKASSGGDDSFMVTIQQLPVHTRLVVVALQESLTRQFDEVAIARVVFTQQRHVVVQLATRFGVAARVINFGTTSLRPLEARLVRHVGLGADDGVDASATSRLIKLKDSVHVAVVGDADGRLAVTDGAFDQIINSSGPVEHRKLGMHMKVSERRRHRRNAESTSGVWGLA